MHLCFSCISYLSFGTEIQGETKPQPCQILTNNNTLDRFVGYIVFAGRGHQVEDFSGLSLYKSAKRGCSMSDMAIWRPFNFTFIGAPVRVEETIFFVFLDKICRMKNQSRTSSKWDKKQQLWLNLVITIFLIDSLKLRKL